MKTILLVKIRTEICSKSKFDYYSGPETYLWDLLHNYISNLHNEFKQKQW